MTVQILKLADCITLTKGKPPAEMPYFGGDAELYLSPEYLRGKGIAESAKPAANAVRVKDGDTVLLWDGSNAGEFFRGRQGLLASTMTRIGHSEEFEPEYFCYAAKRWEAYLKGQTSGSGIPHVDKEVLGKLEILKLPPDEQRLVAKMLAKLDRAIEQTVALIAKQQRIKTGLMHDLLTKGIDEHGNIRSEATHAFKDSPLGKIPVEWDVAELAARAGVRGGKRLPAGHKYAESDTGLRYLQTTDFIGKNIDYLSLHLLHPSTFSILKRYEINDGDVFISIAGVNLGVAGVFRPYNTDRVILTENAAKISIHHDDVPEFVSAQINGPIVQRQIAAEKGVGAGVPKLALCRIQSLIFPWPHPSEQEGILERIESIEFLQEVDRVNLIKLQKLKRGLMHDLLTGERRVTPLLAQVAAQ